MYSSHCGIVKYLVTDNNLDLLFNTPCCYKSCINHYGIEFYPEEAVKMILDYITVYGDWQCICSSVNEMLISWLHGGPLDIWKTYMVCMEAAKAQYFGNKNIIDKKTLEMLLFTVINNENILKNHKQDISQDEPDGIYGMIAKYDIYMDSIFNIRILSSQNGLENLACIGAVDAIPHTTGIHKMCS